MQNSIESFVKITLYTFRYLCYAEGTVQAKKEQERWTMIFCAAALWQTV